MNSVTVTLITQRCIVSRSLQSLTKCSLLLHCMQSHFIWCSVTFFSDTHQTQCFFSVSMTVTVMCSVSSQFMSFMWDCWVMMIVVVWLFWVTVFKSDFKLWLTCCNKTTYSSYKKDIEVAIKACIKAAFRLLLRNVFLTASSYFKPFTFSSILSKVTKCLVKAFSFCLSALKVQVACF